MSRGDLPRDVPLAAAARRAAAGFEQLDPDDDDAEIEWDGCEREADRDDFWDAIEPEDDQEPEPEYGDFWLDPDDPAE